MQMHAHLSRPRQAECASPAHWPQELVQVRSPDPRAYCRLAPGPAGQRSIISAQEALRVIHSISQKTI